MKREAASGFTYLPARTLESLKGIELVARSLVEGALLGLHRSPYHGFSSEFAGDRKYAPGDSIRYLDWKALARSGKYYIKEFEEESNLKSYILLDGSGSMAMSDPAGHPVKFHYACYLAAAFCYLMYQQRDASGLFVYSDRILRASPARAGRANLTALLGTLESLKPEGATRNGACLRQIAEQLPRRSLAILFSDLFSLDGDFAPALRLLRFKQCEVILFQVLNDAELAPAFRVCPAAKSVHHAYAGGLLEHSLGVFRLCRRLADQYPELDRQTLLAGALFHDIGKIREFSGGLVNDYTDEGRLIGHLELGIEMLEPFWRKAGLEPGLVRHLKHLILSHHGEPEYGAVRLPQTAEALVLHYADNIDAKMAQCRSLFAALEGDEGWTPYQNTLSRALFRGPRTPQTPVPRKEPRKPRSRPSDDNLLSLL